MRPHRLQLRAFGPFAGDVEVDLDALAAGGLFLLHGPTGAGKTTLLDAMCFALFGSVPGVRGARRLRSDHAAPDTQCSVTLELTVGGRRLRVTRTPSYERPKKRGQGSITEQPTVRVEERRGGAWSTWSTRPGEADLQIADLVGMSAEQFCRVVLLPQGQFAAFLHADAAARTELLERLFATTRFRAVETWLVERRRGLDVRLTAAGGELHALGARVAQVAGVDPGEDDDPVGSYPPILAAASAQLAVARGDAVAAAAAADAAAVQYEAVKDQAQAHARRRDAQAQLTALAAAEPAADAARQALAAAARAAPVVPLIDRADRATTAARDAAGLAADTAHDAGLPGATAPELRATAEAERTRGGRLEALAPQADRVRDAQAAAAAAERSLATATELARAAAAHRAGLPSLRAAAGLQLAEATAAHHELPALTAVAEQLAALTADADDREQLAGRLLAARAVESDAREAALLAGQNELDLRSAQIAGQAARLAALLVDGAPCAVCGGTEHPHPATGAGDVPGDDVLAEAGRQRELADLARTGATARVAGVLAELDVVTRRLVAAGWADVTGLTTARRDAEDAIAANQRLAASMQDAAAAVLAYDELAAALDTEQARQTERATAAEIAAGQARASGAVESAALSAALGGAPDLRAALALCAARTAALDVAARAASDAARLAAEAAADRAALTAALPGAGFEDAGQCRRAGLDRAAVAELTEQLVAYDAAVAAARAVPELDLPDEPAVDPATSGAVADERAITRDRLAAQAAVLADRHAQLVELGPALTAAAARLAPLAAEHAQVAGLAELARGNNPRGMRLSTYVLAARLEQVAAAASDRLVAMTDGRFTIRHTDVRADRRSRGGLGLEVHDGWTGTVRDTGTLSGGETFIASLALALGLADTVTADAGGAPIEALFVDEGFGSLDEDTLEEVMDVLDALRSGGRVVGVVSHVADLRRRIPTQLQVRKTQTGSTLQVVGA